MNALLFYKVLLQENKESVPIYKKLGRSDFLIGNDPNSYAIPYSPEYFSKWMNENYIFGIFIRDSIKQALLNNNKFFHIISVSKFLGINMIDCQFENIDLETALEGEELEVEIINYILKTKNYKLLKVTFRSKHNFIVSIKRNGVIEIDERSLEKDEEIIRNLLDTVNLGRGVMI